MLTTDLFAAFVSCRYKAFLKLNDEAGQATAFEQFATTLNQEYFEQATFHLTSLYSADQVVFRPASLNTVWGTRPRLILGAICSSTDRSWELHAIESVESSGANQGRDLMPIRFSRSVRLNVLDKLLAACDGIFLSKAHNHSINQVNLIHGPAFTSTKVKLFTSNGPTRIAREARRILGEFEALGRGTPAPKMILNRHCEVCEFRNRCREVAEKRDDVSLLRALTATEVETLNERGIVTVTQLAYTFRAKTMGRNARQPKKHSQSLQAMAIRDKTIYVRQVPEIPKSMVRVYLDIEGLPERDSYYLVGMLVEGPEGCSSRQLWADNDADEESIWRQLLNELPADGDYTIFHFGRYDQAFFECLGERYGFGLSDQGSLVSHLFDLHSAIRTNVFLPVYSNRLKDIAAHLGATWDGPLHTGLDSTVWRCRWERERLPELKEDLLRYNLEDCQAVKRVTEFLARLPDPSIEHGWRVAATDAVPNQSPWRFGSPGFALPDVARFTKCAYFAYQRDKVFFRTDKNARRTRRRSEKISHAKVKINQRIECSPPARCSRCGMDRMFMYQSKWHTKSVRDLKFTAGGVKRWVIEYATRRYGCSACQETCYSPDYPTGGPKFGHGVTIWAVYQQIALRQSFEAAVDSLNDLFGYNFSTGLAQRARRRLVQTHASTEHGLLAKLQQGNLICADEAKISVRGGTGYVWVFSSAEEVIYRYSPNREGEILTEVLGDFSGVLVSDFYSAYDSVNCQQQKCLVHLIRDINDDLLKAPFNLELKELAERFTVLLKPIIDDIDRYGLKKRHLHKFIPKTKQYRDWLERQPFQSRAARLYQKRIEKYGDRLFTFLSHDGVPWNNNLAENAVKLIASRRKIFGASFSEKGMREYLLLLSLYQTLRRKGRSLLRFLLSKETDLFKFAGEWTVDELVARRLNNQ